MARAAFVALIAVPALLVAAGQLGAFAGTPPANLGWTGRRLAPPATTPNSVSSQADLYPDHPQRIYARIDPIAGGGDPRATLRRLEKIVAAAPRARVVESRDDYLRAEFRTRWMGFVDDVEFAADPAADAIQVRSASRLGRSDLGVNRERIERLRTQLEGR